MPGKWYNHVLKCNGKMREGIAIKEVFTSELPGYVAGSLSMPSGKSKLVKVMKCDRCGYSKTV